MGLGLLKPVMHSSLLSSRYSKVSLILRSVERYPGLLDKMVSAFFLKSHLQL